MIKLVAFDWNGTLLSDTAPTWKASNIIFKKYGKPIISLKKFKETFAIPVVDFYIANGWSQKEFLKVSSEQSALYHALYEKMSAHSRTRSGARQILTWLKKQNIKAVIYSNHTQSELQTTLQRLKILPYFDAVLGRLSMDEHNLKRTKEGRLVTYMASKKIKPTHVITIGDTCEEIDIAHTLGLKSVAITGGWNSIRKLKTAKPDYIINSLPELKKIISKL